MTDQNVLTLAIAVGLFIPAVRRLMLLALGAWLMFVIAKILGWPHH